MIQYFPIVTGSLTVLGNINVSGSITTSGSITISGSITSASFATSASNATNAISASYANNLTVAGTLTAQTIVVQTVTSSVIYSSGSNVFGNSLANTQTFTGSLKVTGSIATAGTLAAGAITSTGQFALSPTSGSSWLYLTPGTEANTPYISWLNPSGNRIGYLGSSATNISLALENSANFVVTGGNVGIGTTNPAGNLHINANSGLLTQDILIVQGGGSPSGNFGFSVKANNGDKIFYTDNLTYNVYANTAGGKFGIGTTNPTGNLTVKTATNFNLRVDSYLSATCIASVNDAANAYAYLNIDGNVVRIQGLNTGGNVCIGTTTDFGYKLNLNGQPGCNGYTAWTNWSDSRLKENITDLDAPNVLNRICTIRPVTFNYNELSGFDEATRARRISGFIAQELMEVFPDMVNIMKRDDGNEYYDTNLSNLDLYLIKSIQELNTKFEEYKATHP